IPVRTVRRIGGGGTRVGAVIHGVGAAGVPGPVIAAIVRSVAPLVGAGVIGAAVIAGRGAVVRAIVPIAAVIAAVAALHRVGLLVHRSLSSSEDARGFRAVLAAPSVGAVRRRLTLDLALLYVSPAPMTTQTHAVTHEVSEPRNIPGRSDQG